ncbi:unnamed protein product [Trifolium pratense]|uniref:Uncharacterized protein n=1 Tax=Trifolium pratense TaxID=57577 RepID=A0ACB0M392_TRIPR|nr:unnamed protein product [Trifolium pratense]
MSVVYKLILALISKQFVTCLFYRNNYYGNEKVKNMFLSNPHYNTALNLFVTSIFYDHYYHSYLSLVCGFEYCYLFFMYLSFPKLLLILYFNRKCQNSGKHCLTFLVSHSVVV